LDASGEIPLLLAARPPYRVDITCGGLQDRPFFDQGRTAAVGSVKRPSPERAATTGLRPPKAGTPVLPLLLQLADSLLRERVFAD